MHHKGYYSYITIKCYLQKLERGESAFSQLQPLYSTDLPIIGNFL